MPQRIWSNNSDLIPLLEHDDAGRLLQLIDEANDGMHIVASHPLAILLSESLNEDDPGTELTWELGPM